MPVFLLRAMSDVTGPRRERKHGRMALSLLVQFRFHPYEDFLYEYTTDLSPGGVFLRTQMVRPVGSLVYLQFAPKDGSILIEGQGRIVHILRPGEGRVAGFGVEFAGMGPVTLERIRSLCEEQEP